MSKYNIDNISFRRLNDIIIAVNHDMDEDLIGLSNDDERGYYEHLLNEKAKAQKEYPDVPCIFETVEYDYDDPGLEIYNEE